MRTKKELKSQLRNKQSQIKRLEESIPVWDDKISFVEEEIEGNLFEGDKEEAIENKELLNSHRASKRSEEEQLESLMEECEEIKDLIKLEESIKVAKKEVKVAKKDIAIQAEEEFESFFKEKEGIEAKRSVVNIYLVLGWVLFWVDIALLMEIFDKNNGGMWEQVLYRSPFLFLFVTGTLVLISMFKSSRHRQYAFEEKIIYLKTFRKFQGSAMSSEVKDIVLKETVSSIFRGVDTGLIKNSGDQVNINVGSGKE